MPPLQPPHLPQPVATGPSGPPEAPPASQGRPLKVLYLFSGVAHKLDMATCLQQLAATWALDLRTECVDIKRSAKQDLSLPKVRDSYLDRIRAKEFDAILLSPPCASFSRATWANFRGPRPVRSYELPRGLEKLTPVERGRAILGNIFADFSFEIATLVAEGDATFLAMEQPEDLGALPTGPHEGLRPASMWQWLQLADLLKKGLRTVAFHQASFGVPYAKPTRLLLCTSLDMPDFVYEGLPSYDDQGYYKGPLLHRVSVRCSSIKLKGPSRLPVLNSGPWLWLSAMLLSSCLLPAKDAVGEGAPLRPTISTGLLPDKRARGPPRAGWDGTSPFLPTAGGGQAVSRRGGLCSPGRWPHHARSYADGSSWDWLRDRMLKLIIAMVGSEEQLEKEAFRMAAGGEQGCALASDRELQTQLRQLWKEWLEAQDLSEPGLLEVPSGNRYTSVCCVLCWRPLVIRTASSSGRRKMGYPWASWIRYRGLPTSSRNS